MIVRAINAFLQKVLGVRLVTVQSLHQLLQLAENGTTAKLDLERQTSRVLALEGEVANLEQRLGAVQEQARTQCTELTETLIRVRHRLEHQERAATAWMGRARGAEGRAFAAEEQFSDAGTKEAFPAAEQVGTFEAPSAAAKEQAPATARNAGKGSNNLQRELQQAEGRVHAARERELRLEGALASRLGNIEHVMRYIEADRNLTQLVVGRPLHLLRERILRLGHMLAPHEAIGHSKVRLGGANDGGYILLDDFAGIRTAFSFGIDRDVSWDWELAQRGIIVRQFDYSVERPPLPHKNFRFQREKIVATDDGNGRTIRSLLAEDASPRGAGLILKMDIEGDEWGVFAAATPTELSVFSQIVCEFHGFQLLANDQSFTTMVDALEKLAISFKVIHVHANNHCPMALIGGIPFPEVLEVTFANLNRYTLAPSDEVFPSALDRPNDPLVPDHFLGNFRWPET